MIVIVSCAGWVAVAVAAVAFTVTVIRSRCRHWSAVGYGHGTIDGHKIGEARGYTRGYSQACLDHVLATPTEAQHYAGIVGQLPAAEDSAAFWEAVRSIHDHVGEEAS